jgi:hypothetical protein
LISNNCISAQLSARAQGNHARVSERGDPAGFPYDIPRAVVDCQRLVLSLVRRWFMSALMSSMLRTGCGVAALAVFGFSPASAQAQLVWQVNDYLVYTDYPAAAIRFGADGAIITAGEYRANPGFDISTMLNVRAADGSAVATTLWPFNPVGIYSWNDAAIGPGGEIALCGHAPNRGLIGLASRNGALLWTPQLLPAPFAGARSVTFDPSSGDLLVTGITSASDVFVVRYSSQGALLGSKIWHDPANVDAGGFGIAVDGQGNMFVLGNADSSGVPRVFVLKLDSALNVLWERERYGSAGFSTSPALLVDGAGDVLAACSAEIAGVSTHAFALWKLDASGATLWIAGASDAAHPNGAATCVALDPFGNAAVAGSWSGASSEAVVQSYAPSGTLLWSQSSGAPAVGSYDSVAVDAGGDVLVAGLTGSTPLGLVRRFDRNGNERWTYVDSNKTSFTRVGSAPDGDTLIGSAGSDSFQGIPYLRDYRLSSAAFPVCAGDGTVAPCPCANDSPPGERSGCLHSLGTGGHLDALGQASLANDTLVLFGSSMPSTPVIYFQGDLEIAPVTFGDGLRCAGGSLLRLAVRFNVSGMSQYPGPGDPALSVVGGVGFPSLRMYQTYFRDPASFCTAATFNATNAVRVNWLP